jgi:sugar lactone lactonase YvrE
MRVASGFTALPVIGFLGPLFLALTSIPAGAQSASVYPGTTPVGQTSTPLTVTVALTASGTAAAPSAVSQGTSFGEFVVAPGGSCAAGAYSVGAHCTVNVVFQPKAPGLRSGAVELLTSTGSLLGESLLSATATGSLPVLDPGNINTVAGDGDWIYRGDGVAATAAPIFLPTGVVTDALGNIFLSDSNNNRIRRVDVVTGLISTVAGTGTSGYNGDNIPATQAMVSTPAGLAIDGAGNLYFADTGNHIIRRIDAVTGIITTVAGTPGVQGYSGDSQAATSARLTFPEGVALDVSGNLYLADTGDNAVRKVDTSGTITTIAGTGVPGYNGDGIAATTAQLNNPWNITVAPDGSLYIADLDNHRIRRIAGSGVIATVAGTGVSGFSGDGSAATSAQLKAPAAVVLDPAGNLYIADSGNNRVRKVYATTSVIQTIAGDADESFAGDTGIANKAALYGPYALFFHGSGNLFIADLFHNRIREVYGAQLALQEDTIKVGKTSPPQAVAFANDGNALLTLAAPQFNQAALDSATTTCATPGTLATALDCNLGAEFAPNVTGNPDSGTITLPSDSAATAPVITLTGIVLAVEPVTIALTSSANPSLVGAPVTFTATLSAADTLTGSVAFFDGTTQLCSVTLSGTSATCNTSALALGSHNITATYSGDANNEQKTSSVLVQAVQQSPTLTLAASPNPALVGVSVTLNFTAAAPVGSTSGTPTGTVVFYNGATALGSAALSSTGTASISTTQLPVGTDTLTAQYSGDALNAAGTSNPVSETIQQATSTTSLSTSQANVPVGTSVTFTATVSGLAGSTPTGTVQFNDGAATLGSAPLNSAGLATFSLSTLAPGTHNIVALYSGDTDDSTSHSATLVETVTQIATTTALAADVNPLSAGATLHLTATVAIAAGATAAGPLTGLVTFTDGATTLGTASLAAPGTSPATAVLAIATLSVGPHSIVATYAGNTNNSGSASSTLAETVQQTGTTTVITTAATPTLAGLPATFTATVASQTGTPTGSVTFHDGALTLGSGTLNPQGVASYSTSSLAVGTHTITAVYSGDSYYTTSTSAALQQVVQQGPTTTSLTTSASPSTLGQTVTLTSTVTSPSPNPGGTVQFLDGATSLGSVTLTSTGTASLAIGTLTAGTHILTAVYSGDTNHSGSTSISLSELIVSPATASLASSLNPSTSGNSVTFTIKITGSTTASSSAVPTGTVLLRDGSTLLATLPLDATGSATFSTATLAVASHTLTASYSGDTNYSTASATLIQTVQSANTQVALTAGANPATYATPLTLTATIVSNGSIATGPVTFTDAGTAIGSGVLNASGVATLTLSTLAPGSHTLVAVYAGDGRASASSSTPLTLSVKQLTTVALASSANPSPTLSPITLSATVANAGVGTPTGSMVFTDGATQLGTAALNASGVATLTVPSLAAGSHALVATYSGDGADFTSVSSALTQAVQLRATTTTLSASNPDPTNPQLALLIGVAHYTGPTPATGTITFTNGTTVLGSAPIDSTGVATLSVVLAYGTNTLVATYSGDASYATSASASTPISGGTPTQFSIAISPASMSMPSGQHGVVTVTLTSVNNFTDTMEMGCLGLPVDATCTFSSDSAMLAANGTGTMQLTIDTGDPLGAGAQARLRTPAPLNARRSPALLALLPAGLLLGLVFFRRNRRSLPTLLLLFCAAIATLSASGCGGLTINSTPAGTYTFKVTAAGQGTGATQSQTVTLTVTR